MIRRLPRAAAPLRITAALLIAVALLAGGCGRRTAPRPVTAVLPAVEAPRAWQREQRIVVAWGEPAAAPHGAPRGYVVRVASYPPGCAACPPASVAERVLRPGEPGWFRERGRAYFPFAPERQRATWHFRVAARYRDGLGPSADAGTVRGLRSIPGASLEWEPAAPQREGDGAARPAVRLLWPQRREQVVRIVRDGGPPIERERHYRANLYRRRPGEDWPMRPVNDEPLRGTFHVDRLPASLAGAEAVEYTLRRVDRFGGEGPPAPPVRVPLARLSGEAP